MNDNKTPKQAKFNQAELQTFRLDTIHRLCHMYQSEGSKYCEWENALQTLYTEVYGWLTPTQKDKIETMFKDLGIFKTAYMDLQKNRGVHGVSPKAKEYPYKLLKIERELVSLEHEYGLDIPQFTDSVNMGI